VKDEQIAMSSTLTNVTRRRLMTLASVAGVGAVGTAIAPDGIRLVREANTSAAIPTTDPVLETTPNATLAPMHNHESMEGDADVAKTKSTSGAAEMTVDEMDAMHEEGIKSFPAPTEGLGGQPLEYTMDGDVKVFQLEASIIEWEFAPGQTTEAWAYNGVVPGPEIRVTEGDKIRVHITNNLTESTAIHWHGLVVPNDQDGVPFITQPPIKPGASYTYEFQIRDGNAGTHMYHAHMNSAEQVTKGLLGAFIVEPKDPATRPAFDREYTLILNDGYIGGYSINGKSFPATAPLVAKKGEKVLIRYLNEGVMIHPMHLHGMPMLVTACDGYVLPVPYMCDTLNIAPGQRFEAIVEATEVGAWAFHCHILTHAETAHGMFGMVTVFIVEE
jgi:FtsP/CotA-like multicopper oxidase with cupredoxin domain